MRIVDRHAVLIAFVAALLIASASFAVAQVFGEGAGMPLVLAATTGWTFFFVHRSKRS